ESN
ncbi:Assembly protein G7, partial [Monkeypox virus]